LSRDKSNQKRATVSPVDGDQGNEASFPWNPWAGRGLRSWVGYRETLYNCAAALVRTGSVMIKRKRVRFADSDGETLSFICFILDSSDRQQIYP
jgi:hypothetical protein